MAWLWHKAVWIAVASVLLAAACVLALRYWVLPNVGDYRERVAQSVSEAAGQRVVHDEPTRQRTANAQDFLHDLGRLQRAERAGQRARAEDRDEQQRPYQRVDRTARHQQQSRDMIEQAAGREIVRRRQPDRKGDDHRYDGAECRDMQRFDQRIVHALRIMRKSDRPHAAQQIGHLLRRIEQEFVKLNNVTIYLFPYPIEKKFPGTTELAKAIWCSPDRGKAWDEWMLKGVKPTAKGTCATPIEDLDRIGSKLGIGVTPTVVFADGAPVNGMVSAADMDRLMNQTPGK